MVHFKQDLDCIYFYIIALDLGKPLSKIGKNPITYKKSLTVDIQNEETSHLRY